MRQKSYTKTSHGFDEKGSVNLAPQLCAFNAHGYYPTVWSDIKNVLNSALSMSLSSLSRSNKAANVLEWIIEDRFNTAKEISYRDT